MPQSMKGEVEHYYQNYAVLKAQDAVHEVSLVLFRFNFNLT